VSGANPLRSDGYGDGHMTRNNAQRAGLTRESWLELSCRSVNVESEVDPTGDQTGLGGRNVRITVRGRICVRGGERGREQVIRAEMGKGEVNRVTRCGVSHS